MRKNRSSNGQDDNENKVKDEVKSKEQCHKNLRRGKFLADFSQVTTLLEFLQGTCLVTFPLFPSISESLWGTRLVTFPSLHNFRISVTVTRLVNCN
jgi:hypothetical protein